MAFYAGYHDDALHSPNDYDNIVLFWRLPRQRQHCKQWLWNNQLRQHGPKDEVFGQFGVVVASTTPSPRFLPPSAYPQRTGGLVR